MIDEEIREYLDSHNWEVNAQDCLMKVLNTSYQIIDSHCDFGTGMMTIKTSDNTFIFKWELGNGE